MDKTTPRHYLAIIIGAGFGGLGLAIQLRKAGIDDFTILEKVDRLGGTWRDNSYPGAACDVPSPLYSYSFEQDFDWPRFYSRHADIHRYQQYCAEKYDINRHIQANSEVASARFDGSENLWTVTTTDGRKLTARALITATGQLNLPSIPDIPGVDTFAGKAFHSARWNHQHPLDGKRVAIVGTGASTTQFLATVAQAAAHVTVFQRTPGYVLPKPDRAIPRFEHWLYGNVPLLRNLARGLIYCVFESLGIGLFKFHPFLLPMYGAWKTYLFFTVRDPELRRKLTPDYLFGCKRILFDNTYYPAMTRENVLLVTENIRSVGPDYVQTQDGQKHKVDTLIWGTGFAASDFLVPMRIYGLNGQELSQRWSEGAEAYLGITVNGFPNLFMLYGPNTNLGHNSIIYMLESQIRYVLGAMQLLNSRPGTAIDVRSWRQRRYNTELQSTLMGTVWHSGCKSWYLDDKGKILSLWSRFTFNYRKLTRRFTPEHYKLLGDQVAPNAAQATAWLHDTLRMVVRVALKPFLSPRFPIGVQRTAANIATRTLPVPLSVKYRSQKIGGVITTIARGRKQTYQTDRATLFIHGGAFLLGSPRSHRNILGRLAILTGDAVYAPDYLLAPEHPYPAGLDDVLSVYQALLKQGYRSRDVAVAGDSAGGNLALALCLRLKQENLPLPACIGLISPWVDLTSVDIADVDDALINPDWLQQGADIYSKGKDVRDPMISPLFADLSDLPPVLIHAAQNEVLCRDSERLHEALSDSGVNSRLKIYPHLWHDFQLYAGLLPQASASIEDIAEFIASNTGYATTVASEERDIRKQRAPA